MSDDHALRMQLTTFGIPEYMHEGLCHYLLEGRPVGSFLYAVLTNNLRDACRNADEVNLPRLPDYVAFLYHCAPLASWGSVEAVEGWQQLQRGQHRKAGAPLGREMAADHEPG